MNVTVWEVLGVADDADAKAIRRAYARALKTTRPDEDPAGFQRLTDAYEWALGQARQRERDAAETPPHREAEASGAPGALPELGRPIEAPSTEHSTAGGTAATGAPPEADEAPGFDFGPFFDALAPKLSRSAPSELHAWLDGHPDLYSIDLKWALIPHVVNTLAQHVEAIAPRRANIDVLLAFFGVDARLRRHPALAPALDHIDAHLDGARHAAAAREIEDDRRSPLQMALDADTIPGEVENLEAEIRKARNGRSSIVSPAQARWLKVALRTAGPWRTLLAFALPRRRRAAGEALRPFLPWLRRWIEAGVIPPQAATVVSLCHPDHVGPDSLRLGALRLAVLALVFGAGYLGVLAGEHGSAAWQPVGGLAFFAALASMLGVFFVGGGLVMELVVCGLRRATPWIVEQRWDAWRLGAGVLLTAYAWIGVPPDDSAGVAMAFAGMAMIALHRPLFVFIAPVASVVAMLVVARAHGEAAPANMPMALKAGMGIAGLGLLGFEHWAARRDWRARGLPPEGWRRCALSLLMVVLFWWGTP